MSVPFAFPVPRSFSSGSIYAHAPSLPGVYGISNARHWILIGQSADIRTSLLNHLSQGDGVVNGLAPTGFAFEVCDGAKQISRQNRLVLEYKPIANRAVRT